MSQQSLQIARARGRICRMVVTLIAQTLCDANGATLRSPSKPIGHARVAKGVARLQVRGGPVKEEQPGHWRRLAPSPKPVAVVERIMIGNLVAADHIVVAGGGGGPPGCRGPGRGRRGPSRGGG